MTVFSAMDRTRCGEEAKLPSHWHFGAGRDGEFHQGWPIVPIRVLQISDDLHLAHSRQLILERAGFAVRSISRVNFWAEAEPPLCDVLLICQTVSPGEASALAGLLSNRQPAPPILRLSYPEDFPAPAFDRQLLAPALPAEICQAVHLCALGTLGN